jgi:HSP20 family molecular chaperone IbpA
MPMVKWAREREKWRTGLKMRFAFGGPELSQTVFGGTEPVPVVFGGTEPSKTVYGGTEPVPVLFGGREPVPVLFGGVPEFPPVDIYDDGDKIVIQADVPGFKKEEIQVHFKENDLIISGKREKLEEKEEEDKYYRYERYFSTFSRVIPLPVPVDCSKAKAKFENAVLEITIPKVAGKSQPRFP